MVCSKHTTKESLYILQILLTLKNAVCIDCTAINCNATHFTMTARTQNGRCVLALTHSRNGQAFWDKSAERRPSLKDVTCCLQERENISSRLEVFSEAPWSHHKWFTVQWQLTWKLELWPARLPALSLGLLMWLVWWVGLWRKVLRERVEFLHKKRRKKKILVGEDGLSRTWEMKWFGRCD